MVFNSGIDRLFGEGNHLSGMEIVDLASAETKTISAQTLVFASGRFPELVFVKQVDEDADLPEGATDKTPAPEEETAAGPVCWEAVAPYKQPAAMDQSGLFSEGDVFTDYQAAIKAIGAGRRAAASLHKIMYGIPLDLPESAVRPTSLVQNVDHVEMVESSAREIMPIRHGGDPDPRLELEKGFSEEDARKEAARCLQCGLICYERPDMNPELKCATA